MSGEERTPIEKGPSAPMMRVAGEGVMGLTREETQQLEEKFSELEALVHALREKYPKSGEKWSEPAVANAVRRGCHDLLEASDAEDMGGCQLCQA